MYEGKRLLDTVAIGRQSRNLPTGRDKGTNDVSLNFKGLEPLRLVQQRLFIYLANILDFSRTSLVLLSIRHICCMSPVSEKPDSKYHMFLKKQRHTSCRKQRSRARLGLERNLHASHFYLGSGRGVT